MLLNIGPRSDGTIPEPEDSLWSGNGEWLALNGEAIYSTRPWNVFGEGPTEAVEGYFADTKRVPFSGQDFRFTSSGNTLYAIALAWRASRDPFFGHIRRTFVWGDQPHALAGIWRRFNFHCDADGLTVRIPGQPLCRHAFVLKITEDNKDNT
jgi:alpha-L-fucosidase